MRSELEQVYRTHRRSLFALALSIAGSSELAEDAVHDAFVRLMKSSAVPTGRLDSYVFAAVRNSALDIGRRLQRSQSTTSLFGEPEIAADGEPACSLERAEENNQLRQAIDSLEPASREIVILRTFAELPMSEIAQITGTPLKTVETRYRRALFVLEERLRGHVG